MKKHFISFTALFSVVFFMTNVGSVLAKSRHINSATIVMKFGDQTVNLSTNNVTCRAMGNNKYESDYTIEVKSKGYDVTFYEDPRQGATDPVLAYYISSIRVVEPDKTYYEDAPNIRLSRATKTTILIKQTLIKRGYFPNDYKVYAPGTEEKMTVDAKLRCGSWQHTFSRPF